MSEAKKFRDQSRPLYIFDLDGTLAHNKQRAHLAPAKEDMHIDENWSTWGEACDGDTPYPNIVMTLRLLHKAGAEIWFWSARSARHEVKTAEWLMTHVVEHRFITSVRDKPQYLKNHYGLRMRPVGLCAGDHDIKRDWLRALDADDRGRLVGIFEDRNSVVQMWREEGVTCFHVAEADW